MSQGFYSVAALYERRRARWRRAAVIDRRYSALILLLAVTLRAEPVDPDRPKPHQRISTGAPPAVIDPDPNPLVWPPNDLNQPRYRWEAYREAAARAAPFNPDPGAWQKPPPRRSALDTNFGELPRYGTEPVAAEAGDVRRVALRLQVTSPGNYGFEPLPPGLELPREQVRANEPIELNFHNPHYPKFEKTWP